MHGPTVTSTMFSSDDFKDDNITFPPGGPECHVKYTYASFTRENWGGLDWKKYVDTWELIVPVSIPTDFSIPKLLSVEYTLKYATTCHRENWNSTSTLQSDVILTTASMPSGLRRVKELDHEIYQDMNNKCGLHTVKKGVAWNLVTSIGVKPKGDLSQCYIDHQRIRLGITLTPMTGPTNLYLVLNVVDYISLYEYRNIAVDITSKWEDAEPRRDILNVPGRDPPITMQSPPSQRLLPASTPTSQAPSAPRVLIQQPSVSIQTPTLPPSPSQEHLRPLLLRPMALPNRAMRQGSASSIQTPTPPASRRQTLLEEFSDILRGDPSPTTMEFLPSQRPLPPLASTSQAPSAPRVQQLPVSIQTPILPPSPSQEHLPALKPSALPNRSMRQRSVSFFQTSTPTMVRNTEPSRPEVLTEPDDSVRRESDDRSYWQGPISASRPAESPGFLTSVTSPAPLIGQPPVSIRAPTLPPPSMFPEPPRPETLSELRDLDYTPARGSSPITVQIPQHIHISASGPASVSTPSASRETQTPPPSMMGQERERRKRVPPRPVTPPPPQRQPSASVPIQAPSAEPPCGREPPLIFERIRIYACPPDSCEDRRPIAIYL